jgi:hypothetical protein
VPFTSASAGVLGRLSEIIGCYAWTGLNDSLANPANPVNSWGNFGINNLVNQTAFNVTPPIVYLGQNPASQSVALIWTNNQGAFNLYSTPNLTAPVAWMLVTNSPYFGTNQWTVTDSATNGAGRFYQLGP